MSKKNPTPNPIPVTPVPRPADWMYAAAREIFVDMGIQEFDEVLTVIAKIIDKHFKQGELPPEKAREYLARHAAWVAEMKVSKQIEVKKRRHADPKRAKARDRRYVN